jgi:hypothetical protein
MFMLKQTILNPDFVVAEINQLDMAELGKELIGEQIKVQLPDSLSGLSGVVDEVFDEMAPWVSEEMGDLTYEVFDYLASRNDHLAVMISLDPVKISIEGKIRQVLSESPPSLIETLPAEQQADWVDQYTGQFISQIPDSFEFSDNDFPAEYRGIISQVRMVISRFDVFYSGLIAFMALLVLCLIGLYRDVKGISRSLGSTLLTVGVFGIAGIMLTEYWVLPQAGLTGLSQTLGSWLTQFMVDVAAPLKTLYIGLAAGGLVLFLLSLFYRRGAREESVL